MPDRNTRLASFNSGPPPPDQPLQVLCEDNSGTYVPPFSCEWRDMKWINSTTSDPLQVEVVGWRPGGQQRASLRRNRR
jgi:hypothetical protein